jgi:hypothetical protein
MEIIFNGKSMISADLPGTLWNQMCESTFEILCPYTQLKNNRFIVQANSFFCLIECKEPYDDTKDLRSLTNFYDISSSHKMIQIIIHDENEFAQKDEI